VNRIEGGTIASYIDCTWLVPKLVNLMSNFAREDLCSANAILWFEFGILSLSYFVSAVVALLYNRESITFELFAKAPTREIALLFGFLLIPGAIGIYQYLFGDLTLRIYGGPASNYISIEEYARAQANILLFAINLLVFVAELVTLSVIIERDEG
jgi:hypothetical protein